MVIHGLLAATQALRGVLDTFQANVSDSIDYPFEHAQEDTTLRQFALAHALPDQNDVGAIMQMGEDVIHRLHGLYLRSLGRLAVTAELVEHALELAPIEFAIPEEKKASLVSQGDRPQ